jgi:hypothetical protein
MNNKLTRIWPAVRYCHNMCLEGLSKQQTNTKQQLGQLVCLLDFKPMVIKHWQSNKYKTPNILVFWMKGVWRPDILASCMGYSMFECQSKNKLFLLVFAVPPAKCSSMRQILSYYFKTDHFYFFHILPIHISNVFYGSAIYNQ